MINLRSLFTTALLVYLTGGHMSAQTVISGVINKYTAVTAFTCDSSRLEVASTSGFSAGAKVLLIQMKGAEVSLANDATFGTITNFGNAGNYEFNRIESIVGANGVQLQFKLTHQYDVGGKVQLILVPEYNNATANSLSCQPWDGTTGGVLVFDVTNTLSLQGNLDVSGRGFRGGLVADSDNPSSHETAYFYPVNPDLAAAKGEGIAEIPVGQSYGRGQSANGGGGGNAHNAGGGGGGNAGDGGNGGLEYYNTPFSPTPETNGLGGLEVFDALATRIVLGGGGGAGHSNDLMGTSGGRGGGIVMVKAGTIQTNGFRILANGEDVLSPGDNRNDGQGGGGAGGTVLLSAGQITGNLPVELKGGRGGDCLFFVNSQIIGPGGGGSGGKLGLSQLFPTVMVNLNGGQNGIANQNLTNDAKPGEAGSILFPVSLTEDTTPVKTILDLGPDVVLCTDSTVVFDAGPGFTTYLWQDSSANPTFAASDIGIYWVEVTDACGNKQRDSVLLTVNLLPDTQFPDEVLCAGDSLALSLPGFDTYAWSPASGLSCADCPDVVLFPGATTTYTLLATTSDGCVLRDTFTVEVFPIPSVAINLSFCPGESVTIDGVTYTQSGTVSSVIPAPNGCDTLATYMLTLLPQPSVTKTISFCPGESVTIDGVTYTQPGTVSGVIPAATGCDTLATYVLKFATPAPSQVDISCPPDVDIAISPGAGPTVATYNLPSASSDCSCPGLTLQLVSGLPSGSAFPPGATAVCYQAKDACGNTASCCFEVMIREEQPCDIKKTGCMKYELLSITKDAAGKRTYTIRVTNSCPNPLTYTAIQLPDGVIAKAPANNSVYTAPGGRNYDVRNPNYSPFYSIRFKSTTDSIANGESDIFEYVLPPQAQPAYIHITSRLEPQQFYEAHLNTYYCPVGVTPVPKVEARFVPESTAGLNVLFPNPTTGSLYADLSNRAGESVQIQIFDSRGQRVQWFETTAETTVQEFHLPESIANGLYFFEITGGSGSRQTTRFVLQR